jgi:hypothetical protein
VHVAWPTRQRPKRVTIDGRDIAAFDANGAELDRPFRRLVAQW